MSRAGLNSALSTTGHNLAGAASAMKKHNNREKQSHASEGGVVYAGLPAENPHRPQYATAVANGVVVCLVLPRRALVDFFQRERYCLHFARRDFKKKKGADFFTYFHPPHNRNLYLTNP
jgi:hypothetical protein